MKIRTIIVDDEPLAVELIKNYVKQVDSLALQECFTDASAAFNYLQKNPVDLIFLDIEMPNIKGIELVQSLARKPKVIFTTAYREFALDAFNLNASDYLLKPISFSRFLQAVSKVSSEKSELLRKENQEVLYFKVDKKIVRLYLDDIGYFESYKDYLKVHSKTKDFITYQSMTGIEEFLPKQQFIRIHKGFIVNIEFVEYLEGNTLKVGEAILPIGRIYKADLLELIRTSFKYASKSRFS